MGSAAPGVPLIVLSFAILTTWQWFRLCSASQPPHRCPEAGYPWLMTLSGFMREHPRIKAYEEVEEGSRTGPRGQLEGPVESVFSSALKVKVVFRESGMLEACFRMVPAW